MNKIPFAGLRSAFPGAPVHTIIVNQLDNNFDQKPEEVRICKPAIHATIKTVIVNEVKGIKLEGGRNGLAINGGSNGLTFSENDSLITKAADFDFSEIGMQPSKKWFGDIKVARDIANATNEGEIIRLTAIIKQAESEVEALKAINQANDNAVAAAE